MSQRTSRSYRARRYNNYKKKNTYLTIQRYRALERAQWKKDHPLQFFDLDLQSTINSTGVISDIVSIVTTGLNATSDPKYGSSFTFEKVYFSHAFAKVTALQSDTTTVTDDDYNWMRICLYSTPLATDDDSLTAILNLSDSIHYAADTAVVSDMYFDKKIFISRRPITGSGSDSAPGNHTFTKRIPIHRTFKFINNSAGATVSETESGSIKLERISDSVVSPHPTFSGYIRFYYRVL